MKKIQIIITSGILLFAITSCKDIEKEQVSSSVDNYETYVDSITSLSYEEAQPNWDDIESTVEVRKREAENQIQRVEKKSDYQNQINLTSEKFVEYRETFLTTKQEKDLTSHPSQALRNSLFKNQVIGSDLNFNSINKDNILNVYDYFVTTVINNRDSYSTEQWKEIKSLYEALDERKNVVEKEGLSNDDNLKIAALKLKFAPLYKIENLESKIEDKIKTEKKNN